MIMRGKASGFSFGVGLFSQSIMFGKRKAHWDSGVGIPHTRHYSAIKHTSLEGVLILCP
jgi:hypothetical protein